MSFAAVSYTHLSQPDKAAPHPEISSDSVNISFESHSIYTAMYFYGERVVRLWQQGTFLQKNKLPAGAVLVH